MQYTVLIERTSNGWGASAPDLPGCVAVADTRKEVQDLMAEAMALHIARMREKGLPIPRPTAFVVQIPVASPPVARKKA